MLTRKSIDTVLLSVGAEKLSQRQWVFKLFEKGYVILREAQL